MAHILDPRPQFSESFGKGAGSTIGGALNALAQHKLQGLLPNEFVDSAEEAGLPKEVAKFLQYLSPQERTAFFQKLQPGDFAPRQQAPLAEYGASEALQSPQQSQPLQSPQQSQPLQQQLSPLLEKLNSMASPQEQFMRDIVSLQKNKQQQQQPTPPLQQQQGTQQKAPQQDSTRKPLTIADILGRPSAHEQAADKRVDRRLEHAEKLANRKANEKYIGDVESRERSAKEDDKVLKRIIAIREGGNARSGALTQFLKKANLDFAGLKSNDSLELEKLGNWFLRNAGDVFKGKVSNLQMNNILGQVPNDLQTDEGATELANRMLVANESKHVEAKVMREILKENNGEPPYNLKSLVAERSAPLEESLADKFIKGEKVFTTKSSHDKLPSASEFKGKVARDTETGQRYRSDGSKWTKV